MKLKQLVFKTESGKKIELTPEEAKQMFEQLNELFGNKQSLLLDPGTFRTWPYTPPSPYIGTNPKISHD